MPKDITLDHVCISNAREPYIIAEISGNHNGDINRAKTLIQSAKEAGAHAVKMQTYTADTMTIDCDKPDFQIEGGLWDGKNLYQLYEWAHTPWEWHQTLFDYAKDIGINAVQLSF